MEEPEHKASPIGEASPNTVPSPSKSPPKCKCSMAAEVNNLLTQAMVDISGCKSEHSPLGKITTMVVIMSPPQKSEALLQLVDTSSHASVEGVEASLEDLPANISQIAAAYSSRSVSPPSGPIRAPGQCQHSCQQHASPQEVPRCQKTESCLGTRGTNAPEGVQESASVTKARAICSQVIFDAQMICSQLVQEAKTNCLVAVREAKTNRDHLIHKAEAACSKAIHKSAALRISQSIMFHKEHGKYMQDLEEHTFNNESRSHHDFLSTCQVTLSCNPQPLTGGMATSYHLLLGQAPPLPPSIPPQKAPPVEEQPPTATPQAPMPKQSSQTKKVTSFTGANGEYAHGQSHPKGYAERTPYPQEAREPSLVSIA